MATIIIGPARIRGGSKKRSQRFVGDPADDREQRDGVQEPGDHLEAQIAVRALAVRRTAPIAERRVGQSQGNRIREHVAGIGEQRERPGQHAPDRLHHHEGEDQDEGDQDLALVGAGHGRRVRVIVVVVVVVAM